MADSGKKRKRESSGTSKSPKKNAAHTAAAAPPDITVSLLPESDQWAPVIASTPGFSLRSSISLQPYTKRRKLIPAGQQRKGDIATNELILQSSQHTSVDYIGREEEAGGVDSLLKHYVGVYDPKTGKLEIMEARRLTVRGVVRSQEAAPEALQEKRGFTGARVLRNDLGETFGTKKSRKAIAALTENAISPLKTAESIAAAAGTPVKLDSSAQLMLESMAEATSGMATRDQLQAVVDGAKPRPKANLKAASVVDVYTLESLVGNDTLKVITIKDWQDASKAKEEVITPSKYVSRRLQKVSGDPMKLKALRYILYLLQFFGATKPARGNRLLPQKADLRKALPDVPDVVLEGIKRKFSEFGQMTRFQADLLITHVCALSMIVDAFEVDMYDLRDDLKLEVKAISQYFQEIGARVNPISLVEGKRLGLDTAARAQRKIAKLKLPLDFPKAKFMRKT